MPDLSRYFDFAAATPLDDEVLAAMRPFFADQFYNPSALYEPARQVKVAIDEARSRVAAIIGARPAEIVFTAGGTEANNLAINGIMSRYPEGNMVISAIEHDSVRHTAKRYNAVECPVQPNGLLEISRALSRINDQTVLVSVILANNEIGTIQPIRKLAREIEAIRLTRKAAGNKMPLLLHTDAAQAANYLDLHVHRLGVDLMSLNGGKIYGPKQSGMLYVRGGVVLEPLIAGGGQERGLRSGTENVPAIIGFAAALQKAYRMQSEESRRLSELQKYAIKELKTRLPDVTINGALNHRLPNNLNISLPGQDNERLLILLDEKGIFAAAGSACSASSEEPSHVLAAIGLSEADARSSLRLSMGRQTTKEGIDRMLDELVSILA